MSLNRDTLNEDIQAYLDDELDVSARNDIQAAIDSDEALARIVREYRQNDKLLKQLDIAGLNIEVPEALEDIARGRIMPCQPVHKVPVKSRLSYMIRNIAAAAILLIAGFTSAQFIDNPFVAKHNSLASTWIYRAVGAHKVYTQDAKRHGELPAECHDVLLSWVLNRIGAPVRDVDLDDFGYKYSGGRLIADGLNPAGQLQFAGGPGRKITIYVRRHTGKAKHKTKLVEIDNIKAVLWSVGQLDYAVIGQVPENQLFSIARANGG